MRKKAFPFWETLVDIMLSLAEVQIELGVSVVIDAVFMGFDRPLARDLAARHGAAFRPLHTFVSDERLWQERVERRKAELPAEWDVATWERIQEQRGSFRPWRPGSALFVDGAAPAERNLAEALQFIAAERVDLAEL
jgi:predicted kinase